MLHRSLIDRLCKEWWCQLFGHRGMVCHHISHKTLKDIKLGSTFRHGIVHGIDKENAVVICEPLSERTDG